MWTGVTCVGPICKQQMARFGFVNVDYVGQWAEVTWRGSPSVL